MNLIFPLAMAFLAGVAATLVMIIILTDRRAR